MALLAARGRERAVPVGPPAAAAGLRGERCGSCLGQQGWHCPPLV